MQMHTILKSSCAFLFVNCNNCMLLLLLLLLLLLPAGANTA
jgi:hypothetical protein